MAKPQITLIADKALFMTEVMGDLQHHTVATDLEGDEIQLPLLDREGRLGIEVKVTMSNSALKTLATLPEDHDGHFDGTNIWIGGSEYPVTYVDQY
jgi:hypothetical protein